MPVYAPTVVIPQQQATQPITVCEQAPAAQDCTSYLQTMLKVLSKKHSTRQFSDRQQMMYSVLNILYNGPQAQQLFTTRLHDINTRANFFAINDQYYHAIHKPIKWFGLSNQVSRECITGLGARHCASYITFASSKLLGNPPIYHWRQDAGDTLLANGFVHFQALFNDRATDPVQWDIEQLNQEQAILQPVHTHYLAKYHAFNFVTKNVMRMRIKHGVDLLNLPSCIRYGCYRMRYTAVQGCQPYF